MKNTKTLTVASLMAALCVAVLAVGSLVETLDLSLAILAGLIVMICETEYSYRVALPVFLVAGLLSLFLPLKTGPIYFIAFFGWYPLVKGRLDRMKPFLSRLVKTVLFNAAFLVILVLPYAALMPVNEGGKWLYLAFLLLGNVCFVLYDLLLQRIMVFYFIKIRPRLKF